MVVVATILIMLRRAGVRYAKNLFERLVFRIV